MEFHRVAILISMICIVLPQLAAAKSGDGKIPKFQVPPLKMPVPKPINLPEVDELGFQINTCGVRVYREGGDFYLEAPNCKIAQSEAAALGKWTVSEGEPVTPTLISENKDKKCIVKVTGVLSSFVKKYHGQNPMVSGPNCWNLAMVMAKVTPSIRYVSDKEVQFYAESPLCKRLDSHEPKKPGDVGLIRNHSVNVQGKESIREDHGFVYISDQLVFSRNGSNLPPLDLPMGIQCRDYVYEKYLVKDGASECADVENDTFKKCERTIDFIRCDSMEEFIKINKKKFTKRQRSLFNKAQSLDCQFNCLTTEGYVMDAPSYKNLNHVIEILQAHVESEIAKTRSTGPYNEKERSQIFLLGSLKVKLASMLEQWGFIGEDNRK